MQKVGFKNETLLPACQGCSSKICGYTYLTSVFILQV